jgi:uncharacterized membrane protein YczE
MNRLKRYILFLIGLFINSLGVSLVTKANLGTSPISSIPYVLNLKLLLLLKLQSTKMLSLSADNMAAAVMT